MASKALQRTDKPSGCELLLAKTDSYAAKILHINRGQQLSLQYHRKKEETILVSAGRMAFVFEDESGELRAIPLEVSTNHLDDVVRLEDSYGRAGTSAP